MCDKRESINYQKKNKNLTAKCEPMTIEIILRFS